MQDPFVEKHTVLIDREGFSRITQEMLKATSNVAYHRSATPLWNGSFGNNSSAARAIVKSLNRSRLDIERVVIIGPGLNFKESVLLASLFPNSQVNLIDPNHCQTHKETLEQVAKDFPYIRGLLARMKFEDTTVEDSSLEPNTIDLVYASGIIADQRIIPTNEVPSFLDTVRKTLKPDGKFVCFGLDPQYEREGLLEKSGFVINKEMTRYVINPIQSDRTFPIYILKAIEIAGSLPEGVCH